MTKKDRTALYDGYFETACPKRHGYFHAEKATANHNSAFSIASGPPNRVCVALIVQIEYARKRCPRDLQRVRNATGRDQELAIADLAVRSFDGLPGGIDGKDVGVKAKLDGTITIEAFRMNKDSRLILAFEQ